MFNNQKFEELLREVESLKREHSEASAKRNEIVKITGEAALTGNSIQVEQAQRFKDDFEDVQFTLNWTQDRIEVVKTQLVNMVNSISL